MIRTLNPIRDEAMPAFDDEAGFGCLETARGCLPLISMDVSATVNGLLARTQVTQTFRNSLDEPLEATYVFPLPGRAAVTSFRMRVGDRVVEGQLKERGQARKDYQKAIEDGHRAALAEEDRSGTFSIQVGNIPPQEDVSVELTLVGPLPLAGGEATFRFPLKKSHEGNARSSGRRRRADGWPKHAAGIVLHLRRTDRKTYTQRALRDAGFRSSTPTA